MKQNSKSRAPGRTSKALSSTSKAFATLVQILHSNGKTLAHFLDVLKGSIWQDTYLARIKEIEASVMQSEAALKKAGFVDGSKDADKKISYEDYLAESSLIKNLCFEAGEWVEKDGDDYTNFMVKSRQERLVYKEAHGAVKRPPKKGASDEKKKEYTEPLKITFSRLPPWIAKVLDPANPADVKLVRKVAIAFAAAVEKETGLPVISANTHRENEHDFHIHLVQSLVVSETIRKNIPKKEQAKLLRPMTAKLREEMKAAGMSTHPKDVKKRRDELGIKAPEYRDKVVWKRVLRHGSKDTGWPIANRSTNVLGTAYRCKAEIMDAAESASDKEKIRKTHEVDFPGSFTNIFCASEDPMADFVDYWAEKMLERLVITYLSPEQKKESYKLKKKSVADYIDYGTTTPSVLDYAILEAQKEKLEELQERELAVVEKEDAFRAAGDVVLAELEAREVAIAEKEDVLREEGRVVGRQEFKDEVMAVLPESGGEKTDKQTIAKVKELTGKARLLDKVKPMIKDVLAGVSKLPGLPGRLEKRISKLRDLLFPSENSPRFR